MREMTEDACIERVSRLSGTAGTAAAGTVDGGRWNQGLEAAARLADVPQPRMKTPKEGLALSSNKRGRNTIDGDGGAKKRGRAHVAAAAAASKGTGTDHAAAAHPSASTGRIGSHAIEAAQRRIWAPSVRSGKRDVGVVGEGACQGGDHVSVTPVVELARWMKMKKLRQKLHKLCSRAGQQVPLVRASVQSKRVQTGPYALITCVFGVRVRLCVCVFLRACELCACSLDLHRTRERGGEEGGVE